VVNLVWIALDAVESAGIDGGRSAQQIVHFIALAQQQLG
jgi:hypothetical protein